MNAHDRAGRRATSATNNEQRLRIHCDDRSGLLPRTLDGRSAKCNAPRLSDVDRSLYFAETYGLLTALITPYAFRDMQVYTKFNRKDHVYSNAEFSEIIKDAVRFFAGTPIQPLPPTDKFDGTGIYALYYTGKYPLYENYSRINRLSHSLPIYVGKAVPKGWRQSRAADGDDQLSSELFSRLKQHAASINSVGGINLDDFSSRFVIFEKHSSDMIGTVEAALIKIHTPLWNSVVDGFGNHDPGKGRYNQARSDWDVLHPGRKWSAKCKGRHNDIADIEKSVVHYLKAHRA